MPLTKERSNVHPVPFHLQKSKHSKLKRSKPDWDNSERDLSVYRASEEDLLRRKLLHKSSNVELVKEDNLQKRILKAQNGSSEWKGITKEIIESENDLEDALKRSDRVICLARGILEKETKKQRSIPNVTKAQTRGRNSEEKQVLYEEIKCFTRDDNSDFLSCKEDETSFNLVRQAKLKTLDELKRLQMKLMHSLKSDKKISGKTTASSEKNSKVLYLNDYKTDERKNEMRIKDFHINENHNYYNDDDEDDDDDDGGGGDDSDGDACSVVSSKSDAVNLKKAIQDVDGVMSGQVSNGNYSGCTAKLLTAVSLMSQHFDDIVERLKMEVEQRKNAEDKIERLNDLVASMQNDVSMVKDDLMKVRTGTETSIKENNQLLSQLKATLEANTRQTMMDNNITSKVHCAKDFHQSLSKLVGHGSQHQLAIPLIPPKQADSPLIFGVTRYESETNIIYKQQTSPILSKSILKMSNKGNQNETHGGTPKDGKMQQLEELNRQKEEALEKLNRLVLLEQNKNNNNTLQSGNNINNKTERSPSCDSLETSEMFLNPNKTSQEILPSLRSTDVTRHRITSDPSTNKSLEFSSGDQKMSSNIKSSQFCPILNNENHCLSSFPQDRH